MKSQRGAGLIEALVAILVLSIGLMGMIGMQTASFRYEQTSWVRSALAGNISGLADRIRANPDSVANAYSFGNVSGAATTAYATERAAILANPITYFTPATDCATTACSPAARAAYDLVIWRQALNQQMPGSAGFVVPAGIKGRDLRYTITAAWFDKDQLTTGTPPALASPDICNGTQTGVAARNCCPAFLGSATALAGVRCTNLEIVP